MQCISTRGLGIATETDLPADNADLGMRIEVILLPQQSAGQTYVVGIHARDVRTTRGPEPDMQRMHQSLMRCVLYPHPRPRGSRFIQQLRSPIRGPIVNDEHLGAVARAYVQTVNGRKHCGFGIEYRENDSYVYRIMHDTRNYERNSNAVTARASAM